MSEEAHGALLLRSRNRTSNPRNLNWIEKKMELRGIRSSVKRTFLNVISPSSSPFHTMLNIICLTNDFKILLPVFAACPRGQLWLGLSSTQSRTRSYFSEGLWNIWERVIKLHRHTVTAKCVICGKSDERNNFVEVTLEDHKLRLRTFGHAPYLSVLLRKKVIQDATLYVAVYR